MAMEKTKIKDLIRANIVVSGRVQGVFFRATAMEKAQSLGLTGWVKNLASGEVEAVVEGAKGQVEEFIKWCHHGPSAARVDEVRVRYSEYKGEYNTFKIEYHY